MKLYFKAGGMKERECGWFRFWTARTAGGVNMVFRAPEDETSHQIRARAEAKLRNRGIGGRIRVRPAVMREVAWWLNGHRKKARAAGYA